MRNKKISYRLRDKAVKNGLAYTGTFELLPVCNFQCQMCYVRKTKEEAEKMGGIKRKEYWISILEQAVSKGMLVLLLTGGEPLLHPDFKEIYLTAQKMGVQILLNSNGSLINKEWVDFFDQNRPLRINITLYGASREDYQALCGNGDGFENTLNAIRMLRGRGISVKLNTTVTPENRNSQKQMMQIAHDLGVGIEAATYVFPPVRRNAAMRGRNDRLSPEEAAEARVESDFLQNEPVWFAGQHRAYSGFTPLADLDLDSKAPTRINCYGGRTAFWLDWQGRLLNCGMYGKVIVDHVTPENFVESWDKIRKGTEEVCIESKCGSCPNRKICHSCIAMIESEGLNDGVPEYLCKMTEKVAELYEKYWRERFTESERTAAEEQLRQMFQSNPNLQEKEFAGEDIYDCEE